MRKTSCFIVLAAALVASCAVAPSPADAPDGTREAQGGFPPPPPRAPDAVVLGLLLPLAHPDAGVRRTADDLFKAAQMAVFDAGDTPLVLLPRDTGGTPEGARKAAAHAVADGASLIIGPLFSGSAAALGNASAVPVLAFSNDRNVRARNLWLFGFLPEQNIDRIVSQSIGQGFTRFAALLPDNADGARIGKVFAARVARYGGTLVRVESYRADAKDMFAPVRAIADFDRRKAAHAAEEKRLADAARALAPPETTEAGLFEAVKEIAPELYAAHETLQRAETLGDIPYDAVFMPEGGLAVRNLAPLLPYFDIDPRRVKFIGTGLWDDPSLGNEPPLQGAWYAAPDPTLWHGFARRFADRFGRKPVRLSSLAYDAVSLAARLHAIRPDAPFRRDILTDPNGFSGIDGIFRLTADGANARGLAVQEIGGSRLIDAAPASFVERARRRAAAQALAQRLKP